MNKEVLYAGVSTLNEIKEIPPDRRAIIEEDIENLQFDEVAPLDLRNDDGFEEL